MAHEGFKIPPDRERQFNLIAEASNELLHRARADGRALEHIFPVVPFVETDFSLDAWLFVDTESTLRQYQSDGTADSLVADLRSELRRAGYPAEWMQGVRCHFGSKEVVDREYQGSYFSFLR
jgi:hypothetical protein